MLSIKSFRHMAAAAVLLSLTVPAMAQNVTDYLGMPGPITFDGKAYALSWSSQPNPNYTKQEYLPAGQSSKSYDSMVLVEFVETDLPPLALAKLQIDMLAKRKATDPLVNSNVIQNDKTGEVLLDFILSSKNEAGEFIVEWNGYRYSQTKNAEGKSGGMLFAISHRAYGNAQSQAFLKSLRDFKGTQIQALATAPLPEL
ncbi:hypothetical protein [Foliimonas ilicis]|uniref:hypothetical protein n=1 Tax=Mesorhizobium sp. SB112 TaxID=3151853 RepID=UPI0032639D48